MSEQEMKELKASNHKNYQKLFPPSVCIYCGSIIEDEHESSMTKCQNCLSKEKSR
ncbi:hypothetical protein M3610_19570 [Neobacillus sp. MER 74]|uniref:hypothetical protein n=1 Tax=Neobacillus sp. MER 74 TaxID=2939566 RepID=UPI0020403413|nr:hypothetical protein [Neobacillus sp. MER 74]MCM3117474.1 hypothetical protein [Neobacillus sp. MER 74]